MPAKKKTPPKETETGGGESGGGAGENGPAAGGPEELAQENGNTSSPVRALQLATEELWTASEMEEAKPCDIIEIDEAEIESAESLLEGEEEHLIAGGEPDDDGEPTAEEEDIELLAGYGYPAPFTRWENFCRYTLYPYRTIGKLFFKQGGSSYVCSASSIGGCAIWTAGHCVHRGNNSPSGWSTNVVFVPAYKDGNAPYGQWPAKQLWTRTAWYKYGIPKGLAQDMGGAILYKQGGKKISQRVGWLGFAWNWSRVQHWLSIGYPAGAPFNGKRMQINAASYAYNGSVGADPAPVGMGNDLTGGSSGGPWVWRFGTGNYVNGNNSYRRSTKPKEMFSPYFGNHAKSLYDTLRAGTC